MRKAVALDGTRAKYRLALGQLLAERQRLDEAVGELRQARRWRGIRRTHTTSGSHGDFKGDLDGAEAQLAPPSPAIPGTARLAAPRADPPQKGDLEAAARELRLSGPSGRQTRRAHVLGGVLLKLGDLDGAIEEFRQAARLDPALAEAQVNLAQALTKAAGRTMRASRSAKCSG